MAQLLKRGSPKKPLMLTVSSTHLGLQSLTATAHPWIAPIP